MNWTLCVAFMIQFKNHASYHKKNIQTIHTHTQRKDDCITGEKRASGLFISCGRRRWSCGSFLTIIIRYFLVLLLARCNEFLHDIECCQLYTENNMRKTRWESWLLHISLYILYKKLTCCLACFSGHWGQTHGTIQSLLHAQWFLYIGLTINRSLAWN